MTEIEQAVAAEVAQIVAYLKERWPRSNYGDDWPVNYAIDAIERGEYKETSGE